MTYSLMYSWTTTYFHCLFIFSICCLIWPRLDYSGVTESKKGRCVEAKKEHFLARIYASLSTYKTFYFNRMFQKKSDYDLSL